MAGCFFYLLMITCGTLLCLISCISSAPTCSPSDLIALRSFAASFPAGNFSDWADSDDCCSWEMSVTCTTAMNNKSSTPVTGLFLQSYERGMLNYPIPSSLCNLSSLTYLRLSGFSNVTSIDGSLTPSFGMSGSIPDCIGTHLTNLVELDLSFNNLQGPIPHSFAHLQSLQSLDLSSNILSGPIPPSFSHLQSLHSLVLSRNTLSAQPFSSFRQLLLPNLTILDLSSNAFSGPLPSFNTPLLQELILSYNSFSGSIDSLLGPHSTLSSLSSLDLSYNSLSGEISTFDPSAFPSLTDLSLDHNSFNGSLPDSICGLKSLRFLFLSSNAFSGSLLLSEHCGKPKFTHLTYLLISGNKFVGAFPEWIGSLSQLESLDLSYNSLNGSLPNSWQNLSLLSFLHLSGNSLVAPHPGAPKLPSWFFTLPSLQEVILSSMGIQATDLHCSPPLRPLLNGSQNLYLDLSMNNLSSSVLQCLSNYSTYSKRRLGFLDLSGNPLALNLNLEEAIQLLPQKLDGLDMSSCRLRGSLSGSFFDRIGTDAYFLSLAHNSLEGQVPAQLGNLSRLLSLDLSHNHFTGVAPLKQKLPLIEDIQLSSNHLAGKLSSLLLNFVNISACHLSEFSGNTLHIYNLDVSNNFLTGFIPPSLGQCISVDSSSKLKLSNNQLEGSIPNELFENGGQALAVEILSLSNNQITGPIPSSFRNLKDLVLLDLSHNRLEGSLETIILFSNASSNQYSKLRVLLLGYNEFSGSVPSSLEAIAPALQLIDFSNNHLTGTIPMHSLQNLSAFRSVDTSSNPRLSAARGGTLYEELRITVKGHEESYQYVLAALTVLDLSGNNLSGPISKGLGKLSGLVYLNLSRNRFSGRIPSELGQPTWQVLSLDLSYNELVGPIPTSFQNLHHLEVFNVSYNPGLEGLIPQENPQLYTPESYLGDPNLCSPSILNRSCSSSSRASSSLETPHSHISRKSNKFADWIDEWIAIPGFCLGLVVGLLGTLCIILARMYPR